MQNYAAFRCEFRSYFIGLNFFRYLGFYFFAQETGLIFKSPVATLLPTWQRAPQPQAMHVVQCHYLSV